MILRGVPRFGSVRQNPPRITGKFGTSGVRGLGAYVGANLVGHLSDPTPPTADPYLLPPAGPAAAVHSPDFGSLLDGLASDAQAFFGTYAGASQATPDAPIYAARPPQIEPPPGSQAFAFVNVIATPATDGLDHTVLTFTVPDGWDAQIGQMANVYTGPGFNLSSIGNLTWRILRNGLAVKNFDAIQFAFGQYTNNGSVSPYILPLPGISVYAGDVVQFVVNHAVLSPLPVGGTQIVCLLGGYQYPKQQ